MHMYQIKANYIQKGFSELPNGGGSGSTLLVNLQQGVVTKIDCSQGYVEFVNCCLNNQQLQVPQFNNFQQWGNTPYHGHQGHISVEMPVYQQVSTEEITSLDAWIERFHQNYIPGKTTSMTDPFGLLETANLLAATACTLNLSFDLKLDNVMKDASGMFVIIDGFF